MKTAEYQRIYNFHRRNESNESWRNRYTPSWRSFFVDRSYHLLRFKRCSNTQLQPTYTKRDVIGRDLATGGTWKTAHVGQRRG